MKKTLLAGALVAILAATGMAAYLRIDLDHYLKTPADPSHTGRLVITVAPGQRFDAVADQLHQDRLIAHPFKFKLIARLKKLDRRIVAGVYEFSAAMPPVTILEDLTSGRVRLHKVTIPEGFNLAQIADRIEKTGLAGKDAFLAVATNPDFAARMGIPAKTCEGYLFPDTYYFSDAPSPEKIIRAMIRQLQHTFTPDWKERARDLALTVHEVLILASIIEKETGVAEERPIISSVFHNRLKKKMRLASDPTVIYGMGDFTGNITREDLNRHTPYNTYMISGLPPGPIASPGKASIEAALFPANTDYLYFVAKPDKTHQFSVTLAEHTRAVQKYQLGRGGRRP